MKSLISLSLLLFVFQIQAQEHIDLNKTLFGIEYSFQDTEMVNEPGRNTMTTPHKKAKLREMLSYYVNLIGLSESSIQHKSTWKPGFYVMVPGDGNYVINTEPVTIEFNTTPKKMSQIEEAATPIYEAARLAHLKPYINPAAERSGMGHIHIGGASLNQSPFYIHENLLRNTIAFFHKHPALLYGFAEAYDVGKRSNIETLHESDKQDALGEIFKNYDSWATTKDSNLDSKNGLLYLISLFKNSTSQVNWTPENGFMGWFAHYRFINLEHLQNLNLVSDPSERGKQTVEFRMFRPPPSAAHAKALASLLVKVLDYLAKPGHLENFEKISQNEINSQMTGTRVASDWDELKKLLKISDSHLDSMVNEYVTNIHSKRVNSKYPVMGVEIFESYSEKEFKGKRFEVRIDSAVWTKYPDLEFDGKEIHFFKSTLADKSYWVGVVDVARTKIDVKDFTKHVFNYVKLAPLQKRCVSLF